MKKRTYNYYRASSILASTVLPSSVTGIPTFDPMLLGNVYIEQFTLPHHIRLGHLAERVMAQAIQETEKYELLYENIQLIERKQTIGELDFIIKEKTTQQIFHLEMAYKFYLYDPIVSTKEAERWIGPNRNDSLHKKLEKLKKRQFPLLNHPTTRNKLKDIRGSEVKQVLCMLASLYLPFTFKGYIDPVYKQAVKGYYLGKDTFTSLHDDSKRYSLPPRRAWGMQPSNHEDWHTLEEILPTLDEIIQGNQAALCWQSEGGQCSEFFIVWW